MNNMTISSNTNVTALLKEYALPSPLGFGRELAPIMYRADYMDGAWKQGQLIPFGEVGINPAATCVQFGQQCFEGMKAYKVAQSSPALFRPEMNFARLRKSAARLCMPAPLSGIFVDAVKQLTRTLEPFIPSESGQSLYLRPTLLGLDPTFAVKGSERYCFLLIASPSDAYYTAPIKVMVEREHSRAAKGGTGSEKVGGNYAGSLQATERSIAAGFDQPIWLDAATSKNIEELSGMNFMAVINGALHTPALSGTILSGVTRSSLFEIARSIGMDVVERTMPIDELLTDIRTGACTELFACGTAAIISPISEIGDTETRQALPDVDNVARQLKTILLDIQEGRGEDTFDWMADTRDTDTLIKRLNGAPA
ncbi:branched-chain amino acid aminotransferase [Kordiimonas aquimaris]|uniref:branched-chain amino acid aminotransferase n=1 Tax=Kordiimonas aquimaris TaxID=707591 RepID=UPI0021D06DD4|nr:branched-chain amino acid aminotransferase [Kordiimonas aquimaris]